MRKGLFYFSMTCWTISVVVHVLALADVDVAATIPAIWLLHVGIFVAWVPAIFTLKGDGPPGEARLNPINPVSFFQRIGKGAPTWMVLIAGFCFFYAMMNFFLFLSEQTGTPEIKNGQYVLQNHGTLIRTLTEQEYHHYKANEVRGFSGHWLLFYGVATLVLYRFSGWPQKQDEAPE